MKEKDKKNNRYIPKCTNHDCPLSPWCYTYIKTDTDKEKKYDFFIINGNHCGCDFYYSKNKVKL